MITKGNLSINEWDNIIERARMKMAYWTQQQLCEYRATRYELREQKVAPPVYTTNLTGKALWVYKFILQQLRV